jgi:hypothetical protein
LQEWGGVGTPAETSFTMGKELKEFQLCFFLGVWPNKLSGSVLCSTNLNQISSSTSCATVQHDTGNWIDDEDEFSRGNRGMAWGVRTF